MKWIWWNHDVCVKSKIALRFWEIKGLINSIDPYGWFQWYFKHSLGKSSLDLYERQIAKWKRIVSKFKGKLVNGRFNYYSISPKIRQTLLYWGYEFVESDLLWSIVLFI